MPELPEVETTRRGIIAQTEGSQVKQIQIRHHQLRWPVPKELEQHLPNQVILSVTRRAKYLLLATQKGTLIIHLGMSGNLRLLPAQTPAQKHDHIDLIFTHGWLLRYHDPRRFGAWLWTDQPIEHHPLIKPLAPEPLSDAFNLDWLAPKLKNRRSPIKTLIMNNHLVVGVGNIYANEALFLAGIHPKTLGNQLTEKQLAQLIQQIKQVLSRAIEQGGTTLKDFLTPDGKPGYFEQALAVYGREGAPCLVCQTPIEKIVIGQRATFFCPNCQKAVH